MTPVEIDGNPITGATIDGTDVQEITVDGDVVFSATRDLPAATLGYYPFENDSNSSIVVDESGNGHDGTINSGASYTTDSEYGTKALDCSTPEVDFGSNLPFDDEWAIAFWVKTTEFNTGGGVPQFVTKGGANPYIGTFQGDIRLRNASAYGSKQGSERIDSGNYEHIIVNATNNGDTTQIFINNSLSDTFDTSGQTFFASDDFYIGFDGNDHPINFKIDELIVVDAALTSQERSDIFNNTF